MGNGTSRDQSAERKCRLACVIGFTSSTLPGPCHFSQWKSKFTRKLVKSSCGGEVYELSERVDYMLLSEDFSGHSAGLDPATVGPEDLKSAYPLENEGDDR